MSMRWKLQPYRTGLAAVGEGPRSSDLRIDGKRVATVHAMGGGWRGPVRGWYFVARCDELGIPLRNTHATIVSTVDEAKAQAVAYVRACLATQAPNTGEAHDR